MRVLAITTMRNEAPFILEWIAYHKHIGVTDFLIYSNDCEDGTDALLDRLDDLGHITHVRNHSHGKKTVQWRALSKARQHPLTKQTDWIYVADVDEFLCIHVGDGRISDLIAACPEVYGFSISWRMFGNNGVVAFEDRPVLEQFTQAAPEALLWPWRAVQYKSLYRNDRRYDRLGVHRPRVRDGASPVPWVDGNGDPLKQVPGTVIPSDQPRYRLAQINHYALGAMENFLVKISRGRPNHTSEPIELSYWTDRNFNSVDDKAILKHQSAVVSGVNDLRKDEELDRLHVVGVEWRKAKVAALMQESDSFYMLTRLLQMQSTRVLPMSSQKKLFRQLMHVRGLQAARKGQSDKAD